jgi:hypothetical protein
MLQRGQHHMEKWVNPTRKSTNTDQNLSFSLKKLETAGVLDSDFYEAPNFLIEKKELSSEKPILHFIFGRKKKIQRIKMRRSP